jgi:hypothetical protein
MLLRYRSFLRTSLLAFSAAILLTAATSTVSSAQPFTLTLPAGGETWTAGTTHTLYWTGGNPTWNVNLVFIDVTNSVVYEYFNLNSANTGEAVYTLPASLPTGTYQFYIEEVNDSTWTYGPIFTIVAGPDCGSNCQVIGTAPPSLVCGQTQAEAESLATALARSNLVCNSGYILDQSSIVVDVTLLAVGSFNCPSGYSGAYAVEASAVACCCSLPVPTETGTWSRIKSLIRE